MFSSPADLRKSTGLNPLPPATTPAEQLSYTEATMQSCTINLCLSVYVITFVLGFPTNILAFYTFCKKVRRKPTPIDILLLNLTISDLLFLIFLPFRMQEAVDNMIWNMPQPLCPLSGFVFYMTIYSSTFFLTAVSVERYLGVAYPIQHILKRRPMYAVAASIFFWISSAINMSVVYIIPFVDHAASSNSSSTLNIKVCYENFTNAQLSVLLPVRLEISVVLFFIPLLISTFCYINFIRILCKLQHISRRRRLRAIGMALGTLVVFVICFGPYNVSHIVGFITWKNPQWRDKALLLSTFNACLDPFIFYLSSSAVRGTVSDVIKAVKSRLNQCMPHGMFSTLFGGFNSNSNDKANKQDETNSS